MRQNADLHQKFWLMTVDWLENNVPPERTIYRINYLRERLNGTMARHQHDAMNFIIEYINKGDCPLNESDREWLDNIKQEVEDG